MSSRVAAAPLSFWDEEEASVLVAVALLLTVLLGFVGLVVDMGYLYLTREREQHAAEAAALAAVQALPETPDLARTLAFDYAERNGMPADGIAVDFSADYRRATVNVRQTVPLFFAPLLGIDSRVVVASAIAETGAVSAYSGAAPWGVQEQPFVYGAQYELKAGPQSTDPAPYTGNFGALALGGTGADVYLDNLEHGYQGAIHVGDTLTTETGNMAGPTADGVRYRLEESPIQSRCTFEMAHEGCAEVVIVPVIGPYEGTGRTDVQVLGFAAFYLEGTIGGASDQEVVGRFLRMVIDGGVGSGDDYGVRADKLVG